MRNLLYGVLVLGIALNPFGAWEGRDAFERYPPGSDASPVWETSSIGWEVQQGRFIATDPFKSFALMGEAPVGKRVSLEATLVVEAPLKADWKIAGLVLWQKPGNYWHLALVEAPENLNRRHSLELVESLDNQWLAQSAEGTRLTMTENVGSDFDWQYGRPYRLRMELTPEAIRGIVRELDGTERARLAFRFDRQRAVTSGKPGLDNGGFRAAFDDVRAQVEDIMQVQEQRPAYPPCTVQGDKTRRGKATGFFRVAQQKGRRWLFTPHGEAFYILGTDHTNYNAHWCEKLGYAPYHRFVERKYGSEEAWAQETLRRLKAWGFNALTAGHSESLRYQGLAHTEFISMGAGFAAIHPLAPRVHWTGFPNVFHPKFKAYCEKIARQQCAPNQDNPWLLGYFLDNELEWFGKPPEGHLLNWAFSKPADDPAKEAVVQFFRERYRNISAFNRAWGTKVSNFDNLLHATTLPRSTTPAAQRDREDFVRLLAERYFAVTTAAIRRYDPNHLILGCRFAGRAPANIWDIAGKYCDIVSVNIYPRVDLEKGEVLGVETLLREAYQKAKRPLMITEWSFPALDAVDSEGRQLPCKHGAGMRVDTQEQKARCCELMQRLLFRLPFVVGSNYFMWMDEPALGISSTFPEDSNYGLVSESDKPYEPLVTMFARLNRQVYQIHASVRSEPRSAAEWRLNGTSLRSAPDYKRVATWHRLDAKQRLPMVLVAENELTDALVTVSMPSRQRSLFPEVSGVVAYDAEGREVPVQRDVLGKKVELTFRISSAEPQQPLTLFVYPAPATLSAPAMLIRQDGNRVAVDNGVLRLVKEETDGDAWDRVELNGVPLGRFTPLVHQQVGQDLWVPPQRIMSVQVWNGPLRAVVEMVFERSRAGSAITAVNPEGKFQPQQQSPRAYRTAYRFIIYPRQNWFLAQFLYLENTDAEAWRFADYFHYTLSSIGGSEDGDEVGGPGVPNYYLPFASWKDVSVGKQYGVVALREDDFRVQFWLDEGGHQHPDARREVNVELAPGRRYAETQPRMVVFGAPAEERPSSLAQRLRRWHQVRATVLAPEGRN